MVAVSIHGLALSAHGTSLPRDRSTASSQGVLMKTMDAIQSALGPEDQAVWNHRYFWDSWDRGGPVGSLSKYVTRNDLVVGGYTLAPPNQKSRVRQGDRRTGLTPAARTDRQEARHRSPRQGQQTFSVPDTSE